jgi:hypothetical protein
LLQSCACWITSCAAFGVNHNRVFCTDALFIRTENAVGARERAMAARLHRHTQENTSSCGDRTCADGGPSARIADCARTKSTSARNRRSCTKATPTALAFIHNRVFCTDVLFIRTENTVGARSAQDRSRNATVFKTPYIISSILKHQQLRKT